MSVSAAETAVPVNRESPLRWLDDRSDWLSPLVVKEVRQTVRSREFNLSFTAALGVGLAVAFFGAADAVTGQGTAGAWTFAALMACLAFLGLVVVPLGAYAAIRQERTEQTLELITLTALTPRRLVIGKLLAQVVKLGTLFAGMAPFVVMTFLLGGIDLLTIFVALALLFMFSVWISALCILLSTLFKSRILSALVFGAIGALGLFVVFGARGVIVALTMGVFAAGPAPPFSTIYVAAGILLTFWATSLALLVLLAESRLASATEDRVTPIRIAVLVQFAALLVWTLSFLGATSPAVRGLAAAVLAVVGSIHLLIVAFFTVTEDLQVPRRVWQRIMAPSRWRLLMTMFRPGASRGALFILVQMVLFVGAGVLFRRAEPEWPWFLASCGFICFFTGMPVLIFRFFSSKATPLRLRLAVLGVLAAATVLPDAIYYILVRPEVLNLNYSVRHLINPFRTLAEWHSLPIPWRLVPLAIGLVGVFSYVALMQLGRRETTTAPPAWMVKERPQTTESA